MSSRIVLCIFAFLALVLPGQEAGAQAALSAAELIAAVNSACPCNQDEQSGRCAEKIHELSESLTVWASLNILDSASLSEISSSLQARRKLCQDSAQARRGQLGPQARYKMNARALLGLIALRGSSRGL